MKHFLILGFTCFSFLFGNSQPSTWGNPDYTSFYSKLLNKIDTVQIDKDDFQIRLWFNDGGYRINTSYLLTLTYKGKNWDAKYYTFTSFPRQTDSIKVNQKETLNLNYDALYNQLLKDSLLTLNSDTINDLLDKKGQHDYMWLDAGPTNYTIQIITYKKRSTMNYKCPKFFYTQAKIEEFKMPLRIITALLNIIGIKEPC